MAFHPPQSVVSAGVASLNGLTGAVVLAAGANIALTPAGNTITIASTGGVNIGAPVGGGTPTEVLYIDNAGNLFSDLNFTRDSVTFDTHITKPGTGNTSSNLLVGDDGSGNDLAALNRSDSVTGASGLWAVFDATGSGGDATTLIGNYTDGGAISAGIFGDTIGLSLNWINATVGSYIDMGPTQTQIGFTDALGANTYNRRFFANATDIGWEDPTVGYIFTLPQVYGAGAGYVMTDVLGDGVLSMQPGGGSFVLTDGEATTANGTAVDLGGTYTSTVTITSGGGAASLYIDNIGQTGIHLGDVNAVNGGAELGIASNIMYWDDPIGAIHNNLFGINTISPTEALHVIGNILMDDGTQQAGYVLTSDANGVGTWQAATASMTIGAPVVGGTPTEVLYIDNAGNLFSDAQFFRDSTTHETSILSSGITTGYTSGFVMTAAAGGSVGMTHQDTVNGVGTGISLQPTMYSMGASDTPNQLAAGFFADVASQRTGFDFVDGANNTGGEIGILNNAGVFMKYSHNLSGMLGSSIAALPTGFVMASDLVSAGAKYLEFLPLLSTYRWGDITGVGNGTESDMNDNTQTVFAATGGLNLYSFNLDSVALGRGAQASSHQFVTGSDTNYLDKYIFYRGNVATGNADVDNITFTKTNATGTDQGTSQWFFDTGNTTGDKDGGAFVFSVARGGASGTGTNTAAGQDNFTINPDNFVFARRTWRNTDTVATDASGDLAIGSSDSNTVIVTGTDNINGLDANWASGDQIILIFTAILTLNHNTACGTQFRRMFLANSLPFVVGVDTVIGFVYDGTQFQETFRKIA